MFCVALRAPDVGANYMHTHVKVVGVLFLVLSALGVIAALSIGAIFSLAGGITGAAADAGDAAIALPIIGITGGLLTLFLLVLSIPGLIAGYGIVTFKSWARILGIVLAALQLINFPLGTAFGIYALWALLNKDTERLFKPNSAEVPL